MHPENLSREFQKVNIFILMRCNGPGWFLTHRMACIDRPTALWNGFGRVHHKPIGQPFQTFPAKFFATKIGQHMGRLVLHLRCWHWLVSSSVHGLAEPDQKLQFRTFLEWLCPRLWCLTLFLRCCFWRDRLVKRAGEIKRTFMVARLVAVTGNRLQLSTLLLLPDLDAP